MNLERMREYLNPLWQGDKKAKLIVFAGLLGMALILFSSFFEKEPAAKAPSGDWSSEQYQTMLEQRLLETVSSVEGVGKAKVMITLESGVEYVYAQAEKKNTDSTKDYDGTDTKRVQEKDQTEQSYILVDSGSGKREALLKTEKQPKVKGVVVVCEGAGNIVVEQRVLNVVTTSLDIPSSKVCVTKLK